MTFDDIFRSGFLENIASISLADMVIALSLSFLLGLFIFYVYKHSYCGVMYAASFGVTLIALSMITTLLIMAVVSKRRPFTGHGRCLVDRSFPHRHQRTDGHRLFVLVDRCGNRAGCRPGAAGRAGQCADRSGAAGVCPSEGWGNSRISLSSAVSMRKRRIRRVRFWKTACAGCL